jgi:hypothetical protein
MFAILVKHQQSFYLGRHVRLDVGRPLRLGGASCEPLLGSRQCRLCVTTTLGLEDKHENREKRLGIIYEILFNCFTTPRLD